MMVPDIEVEKVDDTSMKNPVHKVSRRSSEDEGQRIEFGRIRGLLSSAVVKERDDGQKGEEDESSLV